MKPTPLKIKIYKKFMKVYAEVDYATGEKETVQWEILEERKRVLENMDAYTLFIDTRVK